MNIKKLISLLLTFALLFSALQLTVFAADGYVIDDNEKAYALDAFDSLTSNAGKSSKYGAQSYGGAVAGVNYYDQLENNTQRAVYNFFKTLNSTETGDYPVLVPGDVSFTSVGYPLTAAELNNARAILTDNVQTALEAFQMDYPEVFWIKYGDGGTSYRMTYSGDTIPGGYSWSITKITFTMVTDPDYMGMASQLRVSLQNAIQNFPVNTISRYNLIKTIHDNLAINTAVDTNIPTPKVSRTALGPLVNSVKMANSEGYAKAFKLLCDYYGIPCVIVTGMWSTSIGAKGHVWNLVQMNDGLWYAIDSYLDDGATVGYTVIYKDYFLIGRNSYDIHFGGKQFFQSHQEDGDFSGNEHFIFSYPAMSLVAYGIDYSELYLLLNRELPYPDEIYTPETLDTYNAAIEAGWLVPADLEERTDQYIIDNASAAIRTAYDALELRYYSYAHEASPIVINRASSNIYGAYKLQDDQSEEEEENILMPVENFFTWHFKVVEGAQTVLLNNDTIGTGAVIQVEFEGEVKETYNILVYGDVDGDGIAGGADSILISLYANGTLGAAYFTPLQMMAADANNDGFVNEDDVEYLEQAGLYNVSVAQLR